MKSFICALGKAFCSAIANAVLALFLMLLVEFSISGNLSVYQPYAYASLGVFCLVFLFQLIRQIRWNRSFTVQARIRRPRA